MDVIKDIKKTYLLFWLSSNITIQGYSLACKLQSVMLLVEYGIYDVLDTISDETFWDHVLGGMLAWIHTLFQLSK